MTAIQVPDQSIGYVAGFCAVPIFFICDQFIADRDALAISAAFAVSILSLVSCWSLRSQGWFWPLIASSFAAICLLNLLVAAPLARLPQSFMVLLCIVGLLAQYLIVLRMIGFSGRRVSRDSTGRLNP